MHCIKNPPWYQDKTKEQYLKIPRCQTEVYHDAMQSFRAQPMQASAPFSQRAAMSDWRTSKTMSLTAAAQRKAWQKRRADRWTLHARGRTKISEVAFM